MKYIKLFENSEPDHTQDFLFNAYKKAILTGDDKYIQFAEDQGFEIWKYMDDLIGFCESFANYNFIERLDEDIFEELVEETYSLNLSYEKVESESDSYDTRKIKSLKGISCLKNLESIDVNGHEIESLEGIENLDQLVNIDVGNNNIKSLEPLRNMEGLTRLRLEDNQIENLEPLSGLENLSYLNIRNNNVSSVDALKNNIELESFHATDNNITSFEALVDLPKLWQFSGENNPLPQELLALKNGMALNTVNLKTFYRPGQ